MMQFKDIRRLLLAEVDDSLKDLLDSSNDTKAEFNTCVLVYIQNINKWMLTLEKTILTQEKARLTSPEVCAGQPQRLYS